jgi:polyisoprenoid-binding protein YceI
LPLGNFDPSHYEVQFKVKHLMITNVTGSFKTIKATVGSTNDTFSNTSVSFEAEVASLDTGNEQRDGHLISADFFDVANHSTLTFTAKGFDATSGKVIGNLTLRSVTHAVTPNAEFHVIHEDPLVTAKSRFFAHRKNQPARLRTQPKCSY